MVVIRVCKKCGESKPLTKFPRTTSAGNGEKYRRHECYTCHNSRHLIWRENNREHLRQKATENMRKWRAKRTPEELAEFNRKNSAKTRKRNAELKAMIYSVYGGYKCACCGETEPLFLSVDHVENNGYAHRKVKRVLGAGLYNELWQSFKKLGKWPTGYQILCMNCQHGKSRNKGICPHKQGVTTIP